MIISQAYHFDYQKGDIKQSTAYLIRIMMVKGQLYLLKIRIMWSSSQEGLVIKIVTMSRLRSL